MTDVFCCCSWHSPKQIYEMYNGGAKNVTYKLDLAPLDMLKGENFEHDIFKVTNPVGEIKPGQTALLEWHFNPLEAKTYMVRVRSKVKVKVKVKA